jgi:hypothetical protein
MAQKISSKSLSIRSPGLLDLGAIAVVLISDCAAIHAPYTILGVVGVV